MKAPPIIFLSLLLVQSPRAQAFQVSCPLATQGIWIQLSRPSPTSVASRKASSGPLPRKSGPTSVATTHLDAAPLLSSIHPSIGVVIGSSIGHLVGGNLSVPFVIRAVNTWYKRIPKPSWTPPDKVFAPVWTVLYTTLGVAVARVASTSSWTSKTLLLWWCHYAINLLWAPVFFGMARLRLALLLNCLLVASMPLLLKGFAAVDPIAAGLLIPYTAWLIFATYLNGVICKLNPMDGHGYSDALLERDVTKLQQQAADYADGV